MDWAAVPGFEESEIYSACLAALDPTAPPDSRRLAAFLACEWSQTRPARVGLGGGQGAGKTTLGRLIEVACGEVGLRACVLGLDDFYRTKAERRRLGERVHPLLETRGPPGSHDVAVCRDVLIRLGKTGSVEWPSFDKGLDDRSGTQSAEGPFDLVVLEGWCVGAETGAAPSLESPINDLERNDDVDGSWRRYVNDQLRGEYRELWAALDELVFLRVPNLAAVRRWRLQQEEALPVGRRLDADAVDRFVEHYERITLAMIDQLPGRADLTIQLAEDHSISSIQRVGDPGFV